MVRRPSRPARVLASAVAAGALLTCAACSNGDEEAAASDAVASPLAERSRAASPTASAPMRLTRAGARAALITEGDVEDDWTQVKGAGKWRDSLLVGKVDVAALLTGKANAADCQKLLDTLNGEKLLGKPSGASALTGFTQGQSRLLYQVAAYDRPPLDTALTWLKSLPATCASFDVTGGKAGRRTVQVVDEAPPDKGDARQGLRVTVQGAVDGTPATLTLGVAAVRVGTDAITVTAGGLGGDEEDSLKAAVERGTARLQDVQAGRTPAGEPAEID
ncbi:hypothetical protein [Streptomyces sp. NPDC087294]|uniref:hypothetical protein n=1 Tax=Streptomyces sp. NPDC087294 TaxID=3365777 RepID=UPI0037F19227